MGKAITLTSGYATNPSSTFTALTVNSGESLTVPSFSPGSYAALVAPWSPGASAGVFRLRSPRFHDAAQGIRMQRGAASFESLFGLSFGQTIYPSDTITAEITGGAAETDMGAFLSYFDDLPGVDARLANWNEIAGRVRNLVGVEVDLTSGGVGVYGTAKAINASFDTFKASVDYALIGYTVSVKVGVVCVYGPDTGNQHLGGPGIITPNQQTRSWFKDLGEALGRPCIPIINSNNKGVTFVQIADVGNATSSNVTLNLLELAP